MSDDLRNLYKEAGRLAYFFDKAVPCDLFRGQSRTEAKQGLPVLYPNPGFKRKDGSLRLPDVRIVERDGKKIVLGCRCLHGDYRGVSTFDRKNTTLPGFSWFRLPKGTEIPQAIAITQDSDYKDRANHFTVSPKDDMPLELFQVWLNALGKYMAEDA
ncbi:MAG: hypothetical protein PHR30_17025 [Gallionellaceae bacterium]|nr:hypothetical protein [Gallionellaceae bacterium]